MLAIPITSTVKRVGADHQVQETVPRDNLWLAQTPQVFRRELLVEAYAQRGDLPVTDDAQLEGCGVSVSSTPSVFAAAGASRARAEPAGRERRGVGGGR